MNKIFRNIAIAAAVVMSASSCDDVLDLNDTGTFGDLAVWSSQTNADAYVTAAYKTFNDQSAIYAGSGSPQRNKYYDNYSDLMKSNFWWTIDFNQTLLTDIKLYKGTAGTIFECWGTAYSRIKRTNLLLNDLERYGQKWGAEWYNTRRAEARFCNAINYFFLARVYGGVVLRTDHSGGGGWADDGAYESDKHRARISEEATYDHILSELQWAAENLPEEWPSAWKGRATKGIAYAFISRIALYAQKWQVAADAAEQCAKYYALDADYKSLFDCATNAGSKEIIFCIKGAKNVIKNSFDGDNRPFGDRAVYNFNTYAMAEPTAELVDMYEFSDGSTFDWNTYAANHADPYTDREPRFHATVLYNGAKWEGRTIETFVDGADGYEKFDITKAGETGRTCTGYYLRKYLQEGNTSFSTEGSYNTDIVIRYAEVLLNQAEALAQLGKINDGLAALNKVRARVKLPAKTTADAPTLEKFMEILRHERCVELAGEGFRIWDLKRWKLAKNVINGQTVHAHKITKNADGTFKYETEDADGGYTRIFQDRYYYLSLPSSEIAQNKLCKDNEGW